MLWLLAASAGAQAPGPVGDGLRGQYYDGEQFERLMLVRRDPTVDFDWGHGEPAPGLPTEHFSVRWLGWLVVPTTGLYRFQMSVDDGMRVWLNDRVLLNEWRDQSRREYTVSVPLTAGVAYRLRVDYYQDILDTRARLRWALPGGAAGPVPVATRYLFTEKPKLPAEARPVAAPAKPAAVAKPRPAVIPPARAALVSGPRGRAAASLPAPPPAAPAAPASVSGPAPTATERVAALAEGQEVTLPEVYFDQGQARLLPAARAGLDSLARALTARPDLRLEVQGHTDNVGSAELNRQLSQQRAETVCLYLTAHGVAAGQLRPVGYGGAQPVADNADPAQRPRNRRVVLRRL
ncbi:PA14 domain-containing protein [Hymenobacter sp.]|uniref:PA14 domain-containing protein n=1 Tax=Hymenobacter sp. TaxID=1898978 RepID=UPI00286B04B7|nr:PA14 domain-containing protein [Hymenobacter sp.]